MTPGSLSNCSAVPWSVTTPVHHVAAIGALQRFVRVLLRQEDGISLAIQSAEDGENVIDDDRCKADGGLIHHDQLWSRHEGPPDGQHRPFAATQCFRDLPLAICQDWKPLVDTREILTHVAHVVVSAEQKIVQDAHGGEDTAALGNEAQARPHIAVRRDAADHRAVE